MGYIKAHLLTFLVGLAAVRLASTSPVPDPVVARAPVPSAASRLVHEFPNGTWAENLAVRCNGRILISLLRQPELYEVNPLGSGEPRLVHEFPPDTGHLGITELEPDVFYIVTGNLTGATAATGNLPTTFSVWKVDLKAPDQDCASSYEQPAKVTKTADFPGAKLLNGMATLDVQKGYVLIADSGAGVVYRLNVNTGKYVTVLTDPLLAPSSSAAIPIGVNGLNVRNGDLYFTNTDQATFARIPIHPDGTQAGAGAVIARGPTFDDFALADDGTAYACENPANTLAKISPSGDLTAFAGNLNSTELANPTAARFGRTAADRSVLYVTTTGGEFAPVDGDIIIGAQVVAVSTNSRG